MTDSTLLNAFCPTGKLRASINLGNPVLANLDASGQAVGVSVDLSRELAARLGVALELVVFNKAAQSVQAVTDGQADIGFFAIDPVRGAEIAFTHPYVLIEGFYLVPNGSSIMNNADVDRSDHRVVVGSGSAYDLFLSRELKLANIVRATSSQTVVSTFIESNAEVAAGVEQQLVADSSIDGFRLLGERFMTIQQAMGLPKTRGAAAAQYLQQFVEQMKASGFVANALQRHGIDGASVAPLA